jgi:hypothetical protein
MNEIATFLLLVSLCPCARAGLVFEETTSFLANNGQPSLTMRGSFEDKKLVMQYIDNRAFPLIMRDDALYMLNPTEQTFNLLDRGAMERLASNETAFRKRSEQDLDKLPPAQRAMILPALDTRAQKIAEERQPLDLRRTDRHETIGGHICIVWEYYLESEKRADACVVAPSVLAEGSEMLKAMALVSDFLASARQSLGDAAVFLFEVPSYRLRMQAMVAHQLDGVVLRWREFSREKPVEETILTAVHAEALNPAIFIVPAGYSQKSLSPALHVP